MMHCYLIRVQQLIKAKLSNPYTYFILIALLFFIKAQLIISMFIRALLFSQHFKYMHNDHLGDEVSLNRHTTAVAEYAHSNTAIYPWYQVNKFVPPAAPRLAWLHTFTIRWLPFPSGRVSLPLKTTCHSLVSKAIYHSEIPN